MVFAGCEFEAAVPEPLPTRSAAPAQAPSISMDQTWRRENDRWTFSGFVDPRGSLTDVILQVGGDITRPTEFDTSVPVAEDLGTAQPVVVEIGTPARTWLCVRFLATNAVGSGSTRPQCLPTDLRGPHEGTGAPPDAPSPSSPASAEPAPS